MTSPLISTAELADRLPNMKVLDASSRMDGRDTRPEFEERRIPGAVFFDLKAASDADSPLPHTLPGAEAFAAYMGALGVSATDPIVVYDGQGLFSAARCWWMLKIMGAADVRVLDGGLPLWLAEGRAVDSGPAPEPLPAVFHARLDAEAVADIDDVRAALAGKAQVLDARAAARFRGEAPEPRPGMRAGHMPGAISLPFGQLSTPEGPMKRGQALIEAFEAAGVDLQRPVVTTCGSGVTAAILSLGLAELGLPSRVYDGSWSEWGGREDTPVVTG